MRTASHALAEQSIIAIGDVGAGRTTVKQVGRGFGPSEGMTVDFSNLDINLQYRPGRIRPALQPAYMDHWDAWYNNKTFPLAFTDAGVRRRRRMSCGWSRSRG